jgi:hypothetical protein
VLAGLSGRLPRPVDTLPTARPDGKMDHRKFVGSKGLRVGRLINGAGDMSALQRRDSPIYSAWAVRYGDSDICNGGLRQFYWNPTGDFADRFPAFAGRIGATIKGEQAARQTSSLADSICATGARANGD